MATISGSFAVVILPHAATATSRTTKILKIDLGGYRGPCAPAAQIRGPVQPPEAHGYRSDAPACEERVKQAKQAIDDKANVVEMDDDADVDPPAETEQRADQLIDDPDFSFVQGGDCFDDGEGGGENDRAGEGIPSSSQSSGGASRTGIVSCEESVEIDFAFGDVVPTDAYSALGLRAREPATPSPVDAGAEVSSKANRTPAARGYNPGGRDEQEAYRHLSLQSSSNRLDGGNLYTFRDNICSKRAREAGDKDDAEHSFAKTKRLRALKNTNVLKMKLGELEKSSKSFGSSTFEMMMLLREESDRRSEARRHEEELRRREEAATKEAQRQADKREAEERRRADGAAKEVRRLAEKHEAEERRREDKRDAEDRMRRDKEDASARMREMIMLIGAIFNKEK
ncbi:unnamed protein product [Phytophthora fragariaefolia]|uniref:Unnamed protein product n=1 Tax=Phytophthora fragariaefolia TaxID=1490495 RepID=A0A9W6XDU3_9STRA|nr:unnamed protein product [Phytophthora fragariaefolia]